MVQAHNAEMRGRCLEFKFVKNCRKIHCSNWSIAVDNISNRTLWVNSLGK